jgi:hypothetical protein
MYGQKELKSPLPPSIDEELERNCIEYLSYGTDEHAVAIRI